MDCTVCNKTRARAACYPFFLGGSPLETGIRLIQPGADAGAVRLLFDMDTIGLSQAGPAGQGVVLTGGTVTLRPLTVDDAPVTLRWRLGSRAAFMQEGARTEGQQRAWIAAQANEPADYNFIQEYRNTPVGMVALTRVNSNNRSAMMGRLMIGEPEIVGAAPVFFEAEMLLCDFAFDQLRLHKIYGEIMDDNLGMIRTRRNLGYKQDGILRDHYFVRGAFHNAVTVSLLENEYRLVTRPRLLQMVGLLTRR
jgi:diamine N-acetyltransferase